MFKVRWTPKGSLKVNSMLLFLLVFVFISQTCSFHISLFSVTKKQKLNKHPKHLMLININEFNLYTYSLL